MQGDAQGKTGRRWPRLHAHLESIELIYHTLDMTSPESTQRTPLTFIEALVKWVEVGVAWFGMRFC